MTTAPVTLWGGAAEPACFLEALAKAAAEHPARTAVADEEQQVSYTALLHWAGAVAETLTRLGLAPGDRVAVTGPRRAGTVAAMLGCALAGATYLPLDPEYPHQRLADMLHDSGAKLVLHTGAATALPGGVPSRPVPAPPPHGTAAPAPPPPQCRPDRAVYTIYTSGSTGRPKGVSVTHRCLDAMVEWQAGHSPRGDLRTAQFAPLNFDVSFQEILGTLRGAGTVVIVPERLRREPAELLTWLAHQRIERLFLPFVALQMLAVAAVRLPGALRLREVNAAGEQMLCTPQIRALFARLPDCRLVNHYGQSESAMVTSHILTGPPQDWPDLPPIGVPLPGCEVVVAPRPGDGPATGELLVTGLPLSDGYHQRPELTARRYTGIAPTPRGHTRAFRTGDLVRVQDGRVHYLGRLDTEVKIRGLRVDPLEVDAHLLRRPGIDAAVTVAVTNPSGARSLRSAVVLDQGAAPPDEREVLHALAQVLPAAFVPLGLTVLPRLPRTPSGKIDRDAVTALVTADLAARRTRRPGRGERP